MTGNIYLHGSVILRHASGTARYYGRIRGTTSCTTSHYEVLQDTKSCAMIYNDTPWHYKNGKVCNRRRHNCVSLAE